MRHTAHRILLISARCALVSLQRFNSSKPSALQIDPSRRQMRRRDQLQYPDHDRDVLWFASLIEYI